MNSEINKYPYFLQPVLDALQTVDCSERKKLLRRVAVLVGPEDALRSLVGIDPDEFRDFYGENSEKELTTEDTISTFIDKFAPESKTESPDETIPIAPPAIDYAGMMEAEHQTLPEMVPDDTSDMLNKFLEPRKQPEMTEALAKIMIKNGNYRKALEIITEMNLKNPKKSVYFADQIRFLKKLILAQES